MRPTLLSLSLWLALPALAHAQASVGVPATDAGAGTNIDPKTATRELDRVVVTATLTERAIVDVPNTVDIIDRERMDDALMRDLKDLFRYEPGISVPSSFGRFGISDIRIRGLGGNRVLIQTDGIPVSDAFSIGSFSNANRNFVDLDTLKRVEVVRGPGSALYGSDALGGVVSFQTKDPSDYLDEGKHSYAGLKFGYQGENDGLFGGATVAFGGERWSGMAALSHRQGQEVENKGDNDVDGANRTTPNPQDTDGRSLLTKLVFAPSEDQRFKLTVEGNEDATDTDVRSLLGLQALTGSTNTKMLGDDHQTRARVSFAHEMDALDAGFADTVHWQVYRQDSETTQRTFEEHVTAGGVPRRREREFNFDQRLYGIEATLYKAFATGSAQHALTYGLDLSRTQTRQKRTGIQTTLTTGAITPNISPDNFPVRDFPNTRTTNAALFVQDEISFADGAFRLIPAVRVDSYDLDPEIDDIFAEDNPGIVVSGLKETNVSPKLGAVWHFAEDWSLFGGYARGFRAPPYNDVNIGFTNLAFGYTAIPNPDLKPETSNGFELGVRYVGPAVYASLSGYHNRYKDFIASQVAVSQPPQTPLIVFQSLNVAEARIQGVELKAGVDLGGFSNAMTGWSLRGAASYARGDDLTDDVPLNSVDPLRATLGVAYEHDAWGVELAGTFARRKDRVADPAPPARYYRPDGYAVADLLAHWSFAPGAKLNVGVFNLFDATYTDWADVTGVTVPTLAANAFRLDRYTRPGRNVSMSIAVEW